MASTNETIEALAAEIGEIAYIDVAKWHLYLADAHLHTVVAEKMYPLLREGSLDREAVIQGLQEIVVKLGGGQLEVALSKLLPHSCLSDLMEVLERYRDRL
jgi:uncharacterized membrane protein YgcG